MAINDPPNDLSGIRSANGGSNGDDPVRVQMTRTKTANTADQALWAVIRARCNAIGFDKYSEFLDKLFCDRDTTFEEFTRYRGNLPFVSVDSYQVLKKSTDVFLMAFCGVETDQLEFNVDEEKNRFGRDVTAEKIRAEFSDYKKPTDGIIPYLHIVWDQMSQPDLQEQDRFLGRKCYGILRNKLKSPCFLELIWSYWHEEGMLVQTMNAISRRFQNRRAGERDPLANLEIDPLRPINNLLWGWVQDEQHRLSLTRRAYEYDHHYGFPLEGKAVPKLEAADSRSKFLEAFHTLLQLCWVFYKQDDDTTVIADGFPLLNALKEVHLLLTQGGNNQYGDLPWTARHEMLMTQWILSRPEMRDFLSGRPMVAYPERWMERVDTMKALQGWTDTPITHFRDLAVFGEQILLSIRFGAWSKVFDPNQAANWSRYWRAEVQGYIHAYRAVTGAEMRLDMPIDATPPSIHLRNRLATQVKTRHSRQPS